MVTRRIFAISALAAVITASVFGICALHHAMAHGDMSGDGLVIVGGPQDGSCPLSSTQDFQPIEKYSQVDPGSQGRGIAPKGLENTAALNVLQVPNSDRPPVTSQHLYMKKPDGIVSITSPPLRQAFSQGILHSKKHPIA